VAVVVGAKHLHGRCFAPTKGYASRWRSCRAAMLQAPPGDAVGKQGTLEDDKGMATRVKARLRLLGTHWEWPKGWVEEPFDLDPAETGFVALHLWSVGDGTCIRSQQARWVLGGHELGNCGEYGESHVTG